MPRKQDLPKEINEIINFNGISADMEYFDATFEKLLDMLSRQSANSIDLGEYSLLYFSFSPFIPKRLIEAKLNFKNASRVSMSVNNKEYSYHGSAQSLSDTILITLRNDDSDEIISIYLKKSAGHLNRFLGLLTGLSSSMIPVCFKCVCIKSQLKEKLNLNILDKVLSHNNSEWSNNLFTLESMDLNLFYSDAIFLT